MPPENYFNNSMFDTSLHDMLAALNQMMMRLKQEHAAAVGCLKVIGQAGCTTSDNALWLEATLKVQQYTALCDLYQLTVRTHGLGK